MVDPGQKDPAPGETWAYRARLFDPLVAVEVIRHGVKRPARVLVRFVDESFEGKEDWVPPTRLKVPWDGVEDYRAYEERWDRIRKAGCQDDDPWFRAADDVIETLFEPEQVEVGWRESGAVRISDPSALARQLGLKDTQLAGHPLAFMEDGQLIAPWEVTEFIAATAARQNPDPILQRVADEERKAAHEAIHGHWTRTGRRSNDRFFKPEFCASWDNERYRPVREILRSWCGIEANERFDELAELRKEIKRVGEIAQQAIDALRAAGQAAQATRLEHTLGIPADLLRQRHEDAD